MSWGGGGAQGGKGGDGPGAGAGTAGGAGPGLPAMPDVLLDFVHSLPAGACVADARAGGVCGVMYVAASARVWRPPARWESDETPRPWAPGRWGMQTWMRGGNDARIRDVAGGYAVTLRDYVRPRTGTAWGSSGGGGKGTRGAEIA